MKHLHARGIQKEIHMNSKISLCIYIAMALMMVGASFVFAHGGMQQTMGTVFPWGIFQIAVADATAQAPGSGELPLRHSPDSQRPREAEQYVGPKVPSFKAKCGCGPSAVTQVQQEGLSS